MSDISRLELFSAHFKTLGSSVTLLVNLQIKIQLLLPSNLWNDDRIPRIELLHGVSTWIRNFHFALALDRIDNRYFRNCPDALCLENPFRFGGEPPRVPRRPPPPESILHPPPSASCSRSIAQTLHGARARRRLSGGARKQKISMPANTVMRYTPWAHIMGTNAGKHLLSGGGNWWLFIRLVSRAGRPRVLRKRRRLRNTVPKSNHRICILCKGGCYSKALHTCQS